MFVFDNSNPTAPLMLSAFEHAQACDPVVVENDIAFVTLRNGSECQGFVNQMDVVDVSNLSSPKLIESIPMTNPHGLAVKNGKLYVGEGAHGFRILDASNPQSVNKVEFITDIPAYDIIALTESLLFIIGEGGFYIVDAANPKDVQVKSHISVN